MSGAFQLVGGAADPIAVGLDSTDDITLAEATTARVSIPWIRFTAIDDSDPTLEIYIEKPDGTKVYLRASKAMDEYQSLLFEEGYVLSPGWKFVAKAGAADKIDVLGLTLLGDANA